MHEEKILVKIDDLSLATTLCLPDRDKSCPIVLFVHGSGPLDRDENGKGFKLDIFNTLAHQFVEQGIGSLRYDKRGCGASEGDYLSAGHTDLVRDAIGVTKFVQSSYDPQSLFLLGHSEGSIIVPQVSRAVPNVSGLILLCPFIQSLEALLLNQGRQMTQDIERLAGFKGVLLRTLVKVMGSPIKQQIKLIQKIKASKASVIRHHFQKLKAHWFREAFAL